MILDNSSGTNIENGYFVFTMMPSLKCSLNCPHCYLSKEQRRNKEILSLDNLKIIFEKVFFYYKQKFSKEYKKHIIFYWYGGEPTEMGIEYLEKSFELAKNIFTFEEGFIIKNTILTSLITVDTSSWFNFFQQKCDNYFQTSFDGFMRGKNYVKKWENKLLEAQNFGLKYGTISVVNRELIQMGAENVLNYLAELKVQETSFLPFMLNEQNILQSYDKYAPTMKTWNDFMISLVSHYINRQKNNLYVPKIGQLEFILSQWKNKHPFSNIAGQTLFLLPNGDFSLPNYKNGYTEFLEIFGNIINNDFVDVLQSQQRKQYIKKQILKNNNEDCQNCEHSDKCVMEFWKPNKKNDECFGGRRFIDWVLKNQSLFENIQPNNLY